MDSMELGEYIIIKKTQFSKYKKAYDQNEKKKEYAKEYSRKWCKKNSLLEQDLTEDQLQFILDHTS